MAFDNGGVADVRSQLERQAGVRPSSHWLEDCQRELQCSGGSVSADAVLEQILHHDLRDVVREFVEPSPQSPGPPNGTTSCAVQLRKAIQVSQPSHAESDQRSSNSSHKATLSASFRWMVQVEELLDISHNAEARLQVGPASPNAPTPIGNQRKRLLKMCLSDGCYGDGRVFETNSPENSLISSSRPGPSSILSIIGMEISPIPSLSVNTLAGTKLVLQGPITIRHGVMLLHAGNTIVLGGSVPELVEIQISALQQAKRMAGVGVDPTIRALVWNPEAQVGLGGDDEDEGEHESEDVVAPPRATQLPPSTATVPMAPRPAVATVPTPATRPPLARSAVAAVPRYRPAPSGLDAVPRNRNPYTAKSASSSSPGSLTVISPVPAARGANPYVTPPFTAGTLSSVQGSASLVQSNTTERMDAVSGPESNPLPSAGVSSQSTLTPNAFARTTVAPVPGNTTGSAMEFAELMELLRRVRTNPALYQQYYGKILLTSSIRQVGLKLSFNISKRQQYVKGQGEKYEYDMAARFGGPNEHDASLLSCKISSSILEPYFGKPPSEMRKLNREDRKQAEYLVKQGGARLHESLVKFHTYEVRLLISPEEFFGLPSKPELHGTSPVLLILRRC